MRFASCASSPSGLPGRYRTSEGLEALRIGPGGMPGGEVPYRATEVPRPPWIGSMSIRIPIRSETSTSAHPTRTVKRVATRTSPISCLGNNLPVRLFRRPNRLFPAPARHPLQRGDLRASANAGLLPVEVLIVMATRALSAGLAGPRTGAGRSRLCLNPAEAPLRNFVRYASRHGNRAGALL